VAAMQSSCTSPPILTADDENDDDDDENIEVQADFLFKQSDLVRDEDLVSSSSCCTSPGTHASVRSLKSYPSEVTESMKKRARSELEAMPRALTSTWMIKQRSLKAGIAGLKFFADPELNSLLIQVLERKDCLDSPTRAVRAVARIFWSDQELMTKHLKRGYHASSHSRSSTTGETLPYSNDLHDLFMILHEIQDVQIWLSSGKHVWLYNTLYSFRQGLQRQQDINRQKSAATAGASGTTTTADAATANDDLGMGLSHAAKRRVRRSGSACSLDDNTHAGSDDMTMTSGKRMRTDDETSVSSTDATVE